MPPENRVRILPDPVVNKIAAGEVVERPASVVKELMENSLDAGARTIRVRIQGSSQTISVSDDGCGLSADDALIAMERHSTSKISSASDLETVSTMGFRGEALPSIAAVCHFTLESRRARDEVGVRVEAAGGKFLSVAAAALPAGTTVTVRRLFYNTPVRRKFLRSAPTERAHVVKTFLRMGLANPAVRMELAWDGRDLHILPSVESTARRAAEVLGHDPVAAMIPVAVAEGGVALEGFLSRPGAPAPCNCQHFFVNRRPVEDRIVNAALREGFGRLSGGTGRPDFILFLSIDPRETDVNVHPTKREVRFSNPGRVFDFITRSVREAALRAAAPGRAAPASFSTPPAPVRPEGERSLLAPPEHGASGPPLLSREPGPPSPYPFSAPRESGISFLGQAMGGYLVARDRERLVLIDPHAAHERVLYERVLGRLAEGSQTGQELLWPEEVEVQPHDAERLAPLLPPLEKTGVRMERFGPRTLRVLSLPPEVPADSIRFFIGDLLRLLDETDGESFSEPDWWEKPAALIACHAAVKLGDTLGHEESAGLVASLMACREPHRCPHGRPTMVVLEREAVEKMFGRK